jgi:hypothetical protein
MRGRCVNPARTTSCAGGTRAAAATNYVGMAGSRVSAAVRVLVVHHKCQRTHQAKDASAHLGICDVAERLDELARLAARRIVLRGASAVKLGWGLDQSRL